jgi:hypothetical protein
MLFACSSQKAAHRDGAANNHMSDKEDDLRPEYNFDPATGVRGKYYNPKSSTTTLMRVDLDVMHYFSTPEQLNDALRMLITEGRAPTPRNE